MIQIVKPAVAMSIQDQGRIGYRHAGICRSGAMDALSLRVANVIAGSSPGAAGIELGPGLCELRFTAEGTIAIGGAPRDGAEPWVPIDVSPRDRIQLTAPREGIWTYIALAGGVQAPLVMQSRSTSVREGIGEWLGAGDEISAGNEIAPRATHDVPSMSGRIRIFGQVSGRWKVSTRIDRMGYQLEGEPLGGALAGEWSEPISVGAIQLTPSGLLFVMMAEGSTAGGYPVVGYVHSEDLRLLAQTPPGSSVNFVPA